jgi:integrase
VSGRCATPSTTSPAPTPPRPGIWGTALEPVTPHGLRAGFVTQSNLAGARDEEIMQHTRHRHLATMRRYVRRMLC